MKHKILFFDVDGTITSEIDGSISESTKVAIKKLIQNGYHVVAATGRPLSMCHEIADLGIETFISANGAYVKHQNQCIHKIVVPETIVQELINFSSEHQHPLAFYSESYKIGEVRNEQLLKVLYDLFKLEAFPPTIDKNYLGETYLLCIFVNEENLQQYTQQFPHLVFQRWHPMVVNALHEEVSKSVAIEKVLTYFGYTKEQAVAFGDGENDIDMLELVDLSIAMGNAKEHIQQKADYVTTKSSEGGIAKALERFGFI